MTREPVIENGKVIGHNVTTDPVYTVCRDMRGYESTVLLRYPAKYFEPVKRQQSLIGDE